MNPYITNIDTSMNGSLKAILSTGEVIHDVTNIVCHSISTNRPDPVWLHKSNYKGVI